MNESHIFANALKLATPAERAAYLDEVCADDPDLRRAVEALLHAQASDPDFLEQPAESATGTVNPPTDPPTATADPVPVEQPGIVLASRYKLLEEIGEGGMGTVWMAQQTEPVKRMVAVKLIKRGMDTRQVLARFEAERQALALMDHPNIAKVHDAGVTQDGRPFFVMELVKGVPITKFCDDHRLTPRQRLELFVPVCHAIQHAHQKGVIHRDLKPSNVLVALYDDRPVPKVIDFGVAKATGQQLTERTLHTGFGAVVGTVEYMSPEQATFNQLDIDTRSDVYSLGVLLYELLTGNPPFSKEDLHEVGMLEMLRVIREREPSKPSTKLSTAEGLPTLAVNRGTEPRKLMKEVRGELDWIVMKALEKDRSRRYETANGFAMDVQRYLADEVVLARPPSAAYRFHKFARRNKGPMLAASTIFLLLVGGIAGTTVGLLAARKQREDADREANRAIEAEQLASNRLSQVEAEKQRADEERDVAESVNTFLQMDLLGQADPDNQSGNQGPRDPDIKVRTVLDRAAKTIETRFAKQPRVEAAIRLTIANAYYALGNWPDARLHVERSVELRSATLGAGHQDTLNSKRFLALVLYDLGEIHRAEAVLVDIVQRQTETLGPDHRDTLLSKRYLAYAYTQKVPSEPERAEELMLDVVRRCTDLHGSGALVTLENKINLAWTYRQLGKLDSAESMYVELLDAFTDKLGADNPTTLVVRNNLGLVYAVQGKFDQAERHLQYVLKRHSAVYGEDHLNALSCKGLLARLYRKKRDYDRAVQVYEHFLAKIRGMPGQDEWVLYTLSELSQTYLEAKQPEKARPLIAELITRHHGEARRESLFLANELSDIGRLLVKNELYSEAEKHLRQSLSIRENKKSDDWSTFSTQSILGAALLGQKKYDLAEPLLVRGYDGMKQRADKIIPENRFHMSEALERLVQLYDALKKPDEAAKWRKELEAYKKSAEKTAKPKEK